MTASQWLLLELMVIIGVPAVIFPIVAIAWAWKSVKHRILYALLTFLTLWGLQSFFYAILRYIFNPSLRPVTYPSPMFNVLIANTLLVAFAGFPILWLLRNALRIPGMHR